MSLELAKVWAVAPVIRLFDERGTCFNLPLHANFKPTFLGFYYSVELCSKR